MHMVYFIQNTLLDQIQLAQGKLNIIYVVIASTIYMNLAFIQIYYKGIFYEVLLQYNYFVGNFIFFLFDGVFDVKKPKITSDNSFVFIQLCVTMYTFYVTMATLEIKIKHFHQ